MSDDEAVTSVGDSNAGEGLRIRTTPEDFMVVEEPLYETSGEGNHTFVFVEKRDRTTEQVARELARLGGISQRDVGYAGRKDRHAVTRQWFSLEGVEPERALDFELHNAQVLEARRHPHKIKTGHLRGNRFEIVLRSERAIDLAAIEARLDSLVERGMPNRYGEQRFGRDGDNAEQARQLIAQGRPPRDRRAARFLVSALQSEIFNAVLEERAEYFDAVRLGDLARVEESGGLFWVDDLERDQARAKAFEISATGPIFGKKVRSPTGEVAALERAVFDRYGLPDMATLKLPRGIRARGTRRPLRVKPDGLSVELCEGDRALTLCCGLPPGAYVTVLLDELVGPVVDVSRGGSSADSEADAGVS